MLTMILGLIPGALSLLNSFQANLFNAQVQSLQARTGVTRDIAVASIQAQATVQSKWWFAAVPPAMIGFAYASYYVKAVFWDKVVGSLVGCSGHTLPGTCGLFQTDPLGGDLDWVASAVVLAYFGGALAMKVWSSK